MVDGPDNKGRFAGELLISAEAPDVSCLSGVAKPNGRLEPAGVRAARAKGLMDREFIDSSNPGQKPPTGSMGCQSVVAVASLAIVLVAALIMPAPALD